jgi:hypothetical protein
MSHIGLRCWPVWWQLDWPADGAWLKPGLEIACAIPTSAAHDYYCNYDFLPGLLANNVMAQRSNPALSKPEKQSSLHTTEAVIEERAQRIPSRPGRIHSNKGRIHLRRPTCHHHFSLATKRRTIHLFWPTPRTQQTSTLDLSVSLDLEAGVGLESQGGAIRADSVGV